MKRITSNEEFIDKILIDMEKSPHCKMEDYQIDIDIVIDDMNFGKGISFNNCTFKSIKINDSRFESSLSFGNSSIQKIEANRSTFDDGLSTLSSNIAGAVTFRWCDFGKRSCAIGDGDTIAFYECVGDVYINSKVDRKISSINISSYLDGALEITNHGYLFDSKGTDLKTPTWNKIGKLYIQAKITKDSYIHRAEIDEISFTGYNNNSVFRMDLVKVDNVKFLDYINTIDSGIILSRVEPLTDKSTFVLVASNMGSSQFRNCDLKAFSEFVYYDCELSKVVSYNTCWPLDIIVEERRTYLAILPDFCSEQDKPVQKEIYYRSIRNILKTAGEKQSELIFKKHELDQALVNLSFKRSPLATISLLASKWSSLHGSNWLLPIGFMLLITSLISLIFYHLSCGEFSLSGYVELLNPAHRIENLNIGSITKNPIFISLDYLSRVINSYLIFQTIKSFRIYN